MKNLRPVLPTIRTFRNTDVAEICKVWNSHYGDLGPDCQLNALQLELNCLAKPYFLADDLLVAVFEDQVVGFLHFGFMPDAELKDFLASEAAISALCIVPCDGEATIARTLLSQLDRILVERRVESCYFKPRSPAGAFYQGFGPADSMIGATTSERRGCNWLTSAGFSPAYPTTQWELDLNGFQPPVDRHMIQIRRSCQVLRAVDEPTLPWLQSCLLGHAEPTYFELTQKSNRERCCDALFWTVGMELQNSPSRVAWLNEPASASDLPDDGKPVDGQLLFLIAEACRQFQAEHLDLVRATSLATDTQSSSLFRRIGFSAEQSGVVFVKKFHN